MTRTSEETKRLSCYAVLKVGYTGDNYLIPHMKLVLRLICKQAYNKIQTDVLVDDFFEEYNYRIEFFPMRKILSLAVNQGYIQKSRNSKCYHRTDKLDCFTQFDEELEKSQSNLNALIESFRKYTNSYNAQYTYEQAKDILVAYVNLQKLEHISGHIDIAITDKRVEYLFGKYIHYIKDNEPSTFNYLNNVVVGSVLSDCLIYHEELDDGERLNELTVIFDTSVAFMAYS